MNIEIYTSQDVPHLGFQQGLAPSPAYVLKLDRGELTHSALVHLVREFLTASDDRSDLANAIVSGATPFQGDLVFQLERFPAGHWDQIGREWLWQRPAAEIGSGE